MSWRFDFAISQTLKEISGSHWNFDHLKNLHCLHHQRNGIWKYPTYPIFLRDTKNTWCHVMNSFLYWILEPQNLKHVAGWSWQSLWNNFQQRSPNPQVFFSKSFRLTVTDIKEKLMKIQIFGTPHHSQTLPFDWRWHYSRPRPKPVRCLDLTQLKRITRTQVDHIPRRDGMGILYYTFPSWIWPLFHLHCIRK